MVSSLVATNMPAFNSTFFFLSILLSFLHLLHAVQQSYLPADYTLDCTVYHTDNAGYLCEPETPTCETLAYFHVQEGILSSDLSTIATKLFSTTPSALAKASGLSSSTTDLNPEEGIYVPLTCGCNGNFTSHNVTYTMRPGDVIFMLANTTYEGLTTCQAVQDANPHSDPVTLPVGEQLVVPLRCACPSQEQKQRGIKLLVTYPVEQSDSISSVATMFRPVLLQEFLAANNFTNTSTDLFPSTTVLLPFHEKPTRPPNESSMPILPPIINAPPPSKRPNKTHVFIAVAVAGGLVLLTLIVIAASCFAKKAKKNRSLSQKKVLSSTQKSPCKALRKRPTFPLNDDKLKKDLFEGMSDYKKLESYSLDEIKQATQNFHPSRKIQGAVHRGTMKARFVAVKGITRDVLKELQILQKVNHTSLISLLGVCIASPEQTYLVYEFAENGSLHGWLHGHVCRSMNSTDSIAYPLTFRDRLQIALDVASAMEHIHDQVYPSYVHKDINTHNILLDARMRGKLAKFSMVKTMEDVEPATRHILRRRGYVAPEYVAHGMVSPKMDVYAYGVVLLEMLSGEEAMRGLEKGSVKSLVEEIGPLLSGADAKERLREWIDPCLNSAFPLDCAYSFAILAGSCVAEDPSARPNAREVTLTLSKLLEVSLEWQPSSLLDKYTHNFSIEAR